MAKKTKLSEEKIAKSGKRTTKKVETRESKAVEKPKPVKFVKVVPKQAIQPKSKSYEAACEAVGQMFPSGAVAASSEASAADNKSVQQHSKQGLLIALLKHPEGASLSQIMKATGWQAHTVRGVISGVLRKRLCLTVVQERGLFGTAVYKIVEAA